MITDPARIDELSRGRERTDRAFGDYMKYSLHGQAEIDSVVREILSDVAGRIDCRGCANCCRSLRPAFTDGDIRRLSRKKRMSRAAFIDRYLAKHEDGRYVLREAPCPFLDSGLCAHYADRPEACRDYPRLVASAFTARMSRVIDNRSVCPIVFNVYEKLRLRLRRRP